MMICLYCYKQDAVSTRCFCCLVCDQPLHTLHTVKDLLLCGGSNGITTWKWQDLIVHAKDGEAQCVWLAEITAKTGSPSPEVNSICSLESVSSICAACGDGTIQMYDIDTGSEKGALVGHSDMVLSVKAKGDNQLVSGSEDGTVRLWDLRTNGKIGCIKPAEQKSLAQPAIGPWISSVALDEDGEWMACGGGPKASLWYLRSMSLAAPLPVPDSSTHQVLFHDDQVMCAGSDGHIHHWSLNGTAKSHIPSSIGTIYSVAVNSKSSKAKVLAAAGSSPDIDIFTNINYRAFSLTVE